MLDQRICDACPLGPTPLTHPECNRCVADVQAITDRLDLANQVRAHLHYDGVDYADGILYLVLPNLLPSFDPAVVK